MLIKWKAGIDAKKLARVVSANEALTYAEFFGRTIARYEDAAQEYQTAVNAYRQSGKTDADLERLNAAFTRMEYTEAEMNAARVYVEDAVGRLEGALS